MTRRKARENAFIAMFASSFGCSCDELAQSAEDGDSFGVDDFGRELLDIYTGHASEIDVCIQGRLKDWTINRLPRVSLAILRLAAGELLYGAGDMDSVVINEAVELAKKFGDDETYQFVNGVLGNIVRDGARRAPEIPADCADSPRGAV